MIPKSICYKQLTGLLKEFPRHEAPMILQKMENISRVYVPDSEPFEPLLALMGELDQGDPVLDILNEMLKAWGITGVTSE